MKLILLICSTLLASATLYAQAPKSFNYQGAARDLSGNPLDNQSIGVRITLFSGSIGGTVVYRESHSVTTNKLGIFNLSIGNGNVESGGFDNILWGTDEHFVQVEIDQQGGTNYSVLGSSQLLSVPYALHAANGSKWDDSNTTPGMIYHDDPVMVGADLPGGEEIPFTVVQDDPVIGPFTNTIIAQFRRQFGDENAGLNIYGYPDTDDVYPHLRRSMMIYASGQARDLVLTANNDTGNIRFVTGDWYEPNNEKLRITSGGNIQVTTGDVYIEDVGNGVIMKSPNGSCWRMTVSDTGQPVFNSVACPN